MDVSSLYTNIDQEKGAEACYQKLEQRKFKSIPSTTLKTLILKVLKFNVFRFGSNFYKQVKGTAMAPNYANIFLDIFEQNMLITIIKKAKENRSFG